MENPLNQLFDHFEEATENIKSELQTRFDILNKAALVSETDPYGTIRFANDKFCEVAGYERSELVGQPHNIVRHQDMPRETFRELWSTIKSGKVFQGVIKNRAKDGSPYWVDATIAPVLGHDGTPNKFIAVRFDITEQVRQKEQVEQMAADIQEKNADLVNHQEELQQNLEEMRTLQEQLRDNLEQSEDIRAELRARTQVLDRAALVSETDTRGRITFANELFCQTSGYELEELKGKPHNIVRHPDMPKALYAELWRTIKAGEVFQGSIKNRKKDGGYYWVQATIAPVLDQEGKPQKYIGIRFDITEQVEQQERIERMNEDIQEKNADLLNHQEELQQNLEEMRALQEQLRDQLQQSEEIRGELRARTNVLDTAALVSETDLRGRITFVNEKFCQVAQYSEEELLGKPHNIVRHPDMPRETYRQLWATIQAGEVFHGVIKNRAKDGSPYWVNATISPVKDAEGNNLKYIGIRFDITEQVLAEQENQRLLEETREQYQKLQSQRQELKEKKQIQESINYARRIQEALLPDNSLLQSVLQNSFVFYKPKDVVSGDFYWFHHDEVYTCIAAIDCTGHGVPGAFMSVMANNMMNEIIVERGVYRSDEVLNQLQEKIIRTLKQDQQEEGRPSDGMDLGLCIINRKEQSIQYSGANRPLAVLRQGEVEEYKGDRIAIGGIRHRGKAFSRQVFQYGAEPLRLYLFTDGYIDQFGGPQGRKFLKKNFYDLLRRNAGLPIEQQAESFARVIEDWQGSSRQIDDMLVIGFEV